MLCDFPASRVISVSETSSPAAENGEGEGGRQHELFSSPGSVSLGPWAAAAGEMGWVGVGFWTRVSAPVTLQQRIPGDTCFHGPQRGHSAASVTGAACLSPIQ